MTREAQTNSLSSGPLASIGIGVVGVGGVAQQHLSAVHRLSGTKLVGVCDSDVDRAHSIGRTQNDCLVTDSIDEMLSWKHLQAVIVCTPNSTHTAIGQKIAAAGKHILIEKPLGIDLRSVDELITAADRAHVVLMPGHTHRHYDYGRSVQNAIWERLGAPKYIRLRIGGGWIWGGWDSWVLNPTISGGHLLHNGVHGLDLVAWWARDAPAAVAAVGQKVTSAALDIYDYFEVALRFHGGCAAIVEISRAERPQDAVIREVVVVGNNGSLMIRGEDWGGQLDSEGRVTPIGFDVQTGFDRQLAAFVSAIRSADPPSVGALEGRTAVAMALAAEESLKTGSVISLDER